MKVQWHLETGMQGGDMSGEVHVDDDASDEDIEQAVREDMWNYLSLTWEKVDAASEAATREYNDNLRRVIQR